MLFLRGPEVFGPNSEMCCEAVRGHFYADYTIISTTYVSDIFQFPFQLCLCTFK